VIVYGGSGTGDVTESVTAGTATGCLVVGDTVTTTTEGSCFLTVTKAQDRNYETATVSAFIYFITWVAPAAPTVGTGSTIALNNKSDVTVDVDLAPMISSLSTYAATAGVTSLLINGVGFNGSDPLFELKFARVAATGFTINPEMTRISITVPAGARTGKVTVTTSKGLAVSEFPLVIAP
jgi:hypothetical protein